MAKSKVIVLKTKPGNVLNDYKKLMELADFKKHIPVNEETLIKLNLSWSLYFPACSTEPWQLEGVLKTLIGSNYNPKKLHAVENKTVVTNVWKGAKGNKWLPLLKKYNVEYEPLTEVKWVKYKPKAKLDAIPQLYPEGHLIPEMFIGKNIIHLPTVKTHGHTTITGSMKNAFGGLITERRHHSHKLIHEVLVDLLKIQKEIHPNIFTVMDGTVCGEGAGPRTMEPVIKDYILASSDPVAIDAVSAKMMGFEPLKIKFIKMANDYGLGKGDLSQVEVIGEDISKINFGFKTKKSLVVFFDQILRTKYPVLEPILFHTPLFKICIFGSAFYHDYLWYPVVGKRKIRKFLKTEWGELFSKY
ncbi:DUF362 domain-containing protein [Candidatus Woesearchaeota archaeon]|nr:DUF362 domain-containing protein [Candidatus Woesearchaeota archaeon]